MKEKNKPEKKDRSFIVDILSLIPEILLFPFRLIMWMLRGIGGLIRNILDIF